MYPLTGFFVASRSERQFHRTVYSNYPLRDSARVNDYPAFGSIRTGSWQFSCNTHVPGCSVVEDILAGLGMTIQSLL